jgi:RalA-binding protein 1
MPASLEAVARGSLSEPEKRSNSAQGHHNDVRQGPTKLQPSADKRRPSTQADRPMSPERRLDASNSTKFVASNVSGPMNAVPLPSGYEFKKSDRSKKTKSSFWNFGARGTGERSSDFGGVLLRPAADALSTSFSGRSK